MYIINKQYGDTHTHTHTQTRLAISLIPRKYVVSHAAGISKIVVRWIVFARIKISSEKWFTSCGHIKTVYFFSSLWTIDCPRLFVSRVIEIDLWIYLRSLRVDYINHLIMTSIQNYEKTRINDSRNSHSRRFFVNESSKLGKHIRYFNKARKNAEIFSRSIFLELHFLWTPLILKVHFLWTPLTPAVFDYPTWFVR